MRWPFISPPLRDWSRGTKRAGATGIQPGGGGSSGGGDGGGGRSGGGSCSFFPPPLFIGEKAREQRRRGYTLLPLPLSLSG